MQHKEDERNTLFCFGGLQPERLQAYTRGKGRLNKVGNEILKLLERESTMRLEPVGNAIKIRHIMTMAFRNVKVMNKVRSSQLGGGLVKRFSPLITIKHLCTSKYFTTQSKLRIEELFY